MPDKALIGLLDLPSEAGKAAGSGKEKFKIFSCVGQLNHQAAFERKEKKSGTAAVHGKSGMLQFSAGPLAGNTAGGKLKPGMIIAASPMLIGVPAAAFRIYSVKFSI